ncbi:MAG: cytochrome c [Acidobacteriota bacterium]|nr:cytochrome c [Acidobacteriota bacterium]
MTATVSGDGCQVTAATKGMQSTLVLSAMLALSVITGCRQEMYDQPKYKDLRRSEFFADQRQARPLPEGTVARGFLREDSRVFAGKVGNDLVTEFPIRVDAALLRRGRQRFDIFCSPCHDRTGSGGGMVVKRGYRPPPSFHIDRLRAVPVGYVFDVITNGFGAMPDYAAQIDVSDRWAIVAYVRALQLSQNAPVSSMAAADRERLASAPAAPVPQTPTPHPVPFPIPAAASTESR